MERPVIQEVLFRRGPPAADRRAPAQPGAPCAIRRALAQVYGEVGYRPLPEPLARIVLEIEGSEVCDSARCATHPM